MKTTNPKEFLQDYWVARWMKQQEVNPSLFKHHPENIEPKRYLQWRNAFVWSLLLTIPAALYSLALVGDAWPDSLRFEDDVKTSGLLVCCGFFFTFFSLLLKKSWFPGYKVVEMHQSWKKVERKLDKYPRILRKLRAILPEHSGSGNTAKQTIGLAFGKYLTSLVEEIEASEAVGKPKEKEMAHEELRKVFNFSAELGIFPAEKGWDPFFKRTYRFQLGLGPETDSTLLPHRGYEVPTCG